LARRVGRDGCLCTARLGVGERGLVRGSQSGRDAVGVDGPAGAARGRLSRIAGAPPYGSTSPHRRGSESMIASAEPTMFAETLREQCVEALSRAEREARAVIVSLTVALPDPPDLVGFFARGGSSTYRAYWEQHTEGIAFVGLGVARIIRCYGPRRFLD